MAAKAFCYQNGTISIDTEVPAVAKAFREGKRSELAQLLNIVAKRSFHGVLSVPHVTGCNPARDFLALEEFANQLRKTLMVYQATNKFLSLEVVL